MKKNIVTISAALFLAGCSVYHSDLPQQLPTLPETYLETHSDTELTEPGRFWESFNDPVLNELVKEALDGNLTIRQVIARHKQFSALEKISNAGKLPFLNLTGSVGADDPLNSSEGNSMRLSAVAGYEVDLWNKLGSERDKASANLQASMADIKAAYISIVAQVTDLYFLLVEQRAQLKLSDRIIESQADTLARMERRYDAGLIQALDVYQARQNILAAKAAKPPYQSNLDKGGHALAVLLGRFSVPDPGGDQSELLRVDDRVLPGIPMQLIARRPDIEAALLRLKAKDAEVAAVVADRYPSLNLTAVFGTGRLDYTKVLSDTFWSLLLEVVQPVFDNGRRKAEIDRRKAVVEEELARYHQVVIKAVQEVEDALSSYRNGLKQMQILEERYVATADTLRLAEDQYFAGLTEYLSVLTAQVNYYNVQRQLLSSRRQLISDRISLYRALGGDWMVKDINTRNSENGDKK